MATTSLFGDASLGVVVYGPDGKAYGSPAAARAAGVTNYTMSPPAAARPAAPAYKQQYIPGNYTPILVDENTGNPLPMRYGDPIYSVATDRVPSKLIGRVGMAPVVTPANNERGAPSITFTDDPVYQKSQQMLDFEKKIASGEVESSGLYGPALDGGKERRAFAERESAYTSYDPKTNIVKFYDPEGNVTQEGQRAGSVLSGPLGDLMTGLNQTAANPDFQRAVMLAALGTAGYAALGGLTPAVDLGLSAGGADAAGALAGGAGADVVAGTGALGSAGGGLLSGAGTTALTPAALESLAGSAGYGLNASALAAAPTLGIPAAAVGSGALLGLGSVTPALTPAALESLIGSSGYGLNASALAAAPALGIPAAAVGSGALIGSSLGSSALGGGSLANATTGAAASGVGATPALTPAALESLIGSSGYGVNAAALEAANVLGIPAATVGAGGLFGIGSVTPTLTPAALESLIGTSGYGVNAAAQAAAPVLGINPALVGSGALTGAGLFGGTGITPSIPVVSTNEAIASGMTPGSVGAQTAAQSGLTAAQIAAASGTVGAGSALEGLATSGNTAALTNLLNSGATSGLLSSAGNAISNLLPSTSTVSSLLPSASTASSLFPSLITGALQTLGAANTAEKSREAAQIQADAQIKAAQIAADAAKFRPVGVTTRFGSSNFTTDAQGNVIGAGYTASPEIQAYQNRLSALAAQGLTGAEGARAAYAPLTTGAQSLFNLGQSYIKQTPEQQAADYIAKQQALLAPSQQQQLAQLQNKLLAQGRGGLSVAQGGNLSATSPELAAYYNALAQSNLQLAAQGQQAGMEQAKFGAGLLGTGSDLLGKYYAGQTAAYSPFTTAIDTSSGLESLAQQPLTLGTQIGAKTTASSAEAGKLLAQGMVNSAATQAPANAFSYSGDLLSQVASNPALQDYLRKAFAV